MRKFFGFGSSTPPPPPPPSRPPSPPAKPTPAAAAPAKPASATEKPAPAAPPAAVAPLAPAAPAPTIVGRWQETGSKDTTEFHADGSVTERTGIGETIRGRYSLRDKQLKINLEGVPDELSFPVAIGPDSLEMTDPEGKVTHYRRVK